MILMLMVMRKRMIVMHRKVSPISRRLVTLCTSQVVSAWMMRMNMMNIFCANNHCTILLYCYLVRSRSEENIINQKMHPTTCLYICKEYPLMQLGV